MHQEVESPTCLGSNVDKNGRSDADNKITVEVPERQWSFLSTRTFVNVVIKSSTKLRIFNCNTKSVLIYGSETWRMAKTI